MFFIRWAGIATTAALVVGLIFGGMYWFAIKPGTESQGAYMPGSDLVVTRDTERGTELCFHYVGFNQALSGRSMTAPAWHSYEFPNRRPASSSRGDWELAVEYYSSWRAIQEDESQTVGFPSLESTQRVEQGCDRTIIEIGVLDPPPREQQTCFSWDNWAARHEVQSVEWIRFYGAETESGRVVVLGTIEPSREDLEVLLDLAIGMGIVEQAGDDEYRFEEMNEYMLHVRFVSADHSHLASPPNCQPPAIPDHIRGIE